MLSLGRNLPLGIVTNCWRVQLAGGDSLVDLIGEAVGRGYGVFELRQTCLGEFEAGEQSLPLAAELTRLPRTFPGIRLNMALAVGFLQPSFSADHPVFAAGRRAAQAVAGGYPPHLRLVDPVDAGLIDSAEETGRRLAQLARAMIEFDGQLSIEQSRQPWGDFYAAFSAARGELGPDCGRLRICHDPCNLLTPAGAADPRKVTASLAADELSMVHAKQRRPGPLPMVDDGEVDWAAQAEALRAIAYAGPLLLEIEPDADIWRNLEASVNYLRSAGCPIRLQPKSD